MSPGMPRGLRGNNPGNIRRGPVPWQGMAPEQRDPEFVTFAAPEWGLRAIVRILHTYRSRGRASIRQMIEQWAPPVENDTTSYVEHVASAAGFQADHPLTGPEFEATLPALVKAIVRHENGQQPYDDALIARAIEMA